MSNGSVTLLTQYIKAHLERLAFLQEYYQNIQNAQVRLALNMVIEDTQEAIARASSRLRQLGQAPGQTLAVTDEKLLRQSRSRRSVVDKLKFVRHGLKHQLEWYQNHLPDLTDDPDSQAILVGLAEQAKLRLERWESLMKDLKVSLD